MINGEGYITLRITTPAYHSTLLTYFHTFKFTINYPTQLEITLRTEMKSLSFLLSICFSIIHGFPEIPGAPDPDRSGDRPGLLVEFIENGTTYKFASMQDDSVITVLENGDVISEVWKNLPTQKWTIVTHPRDGQFMEFQQSVVPYNMLSGYEPIPEQPEIYPRPLTLTKHRIMPSLKDNGMDFIPIPWQILIRIRWCLQSNGVGRPLDYDDCEYQPAPWQFWKLEAVDP